MSLASMTGFARTHGLTGAWRWTWEVRSVNSKGLDLRLRLPGGFDALDAGARAAATKALSRGSVSGTLTLAREGEPAAVSLNQPALRTLYTALKEAAAVLGAAPPTLDALLAVRGIVEVVEADLSDEDRAAVTRDALAGFEDALADLGRMRIAEGAALRAILMDRLDGIARLVAAAESLPERQLEAIKARLADQVRALSEAHAGLDPERLHQEAVLLATKADVREELDRLTAHIAAARELLTQGGPVGRRLDFLAQEFNREANTLCSKSNAVALTQIGLDLKLLVDQFREQIANVE